MPPKNPPTSAALVAAAARAAAMAGEVMAVTVRTAPGGVPPGDLLAALVGEATAGAPCECTPRRPACPPLAVACTAAIPPRGI